MKQQRAKALLSAIAWVGLALSSQAQNPLIQHHYAADPAPFVYNDRMYVYYDRDEGGSFYTMNEWRVISSSDLVNWTDHGDVLPTTAFSWADIDSHSAWASQCIERNGKFYWYICVQYKGDWRHTIGVAVSDSPSGPFKDALGKPLIPVTEGGQIDPTVFIDDDGQAYLYYGNNMLRYVKLNENMISYDKKIGKNGVVTVELTKEAFGGVKKTRTKADGSEETYVDGVDCYEEGPWLHKYNGKYYLSYAAGGVPEHMSYSMSDSPTGPWKYAGVIMPSKNTGSFTNHGGVVEFRGKQYVAYHTGWLPGGGGFTRSAALEEFTYNADGTIPQVTETRNGVKAVGTINPYDLQEAETMNTSTGLWVYTKPEPRTIYVGNIDKMDTLRVRCVDFGEGAGAFTAHVSSAKNTGYIEVYADKVTSTKLLAKVPVPYTEGDENWLPVSVPISKEVSGVHDLVFRFNCTSTNDKTGTFTFDKWQFTAKSTEKKLVGLNAKLDKTVIDMDEQYGNTALLTVMATYSDGTEEDVTDAATVSANDESLISREGSTILGSGYGKAVLTISYGGVSTERYLTIRSYFNENAVEFIHLEGDNLSEDVCTLLNGSTQSLTAKAVYFDGHEVDVSGTATFTCDDTNIVRNTRAKLTAKQEGDANLTVSCKGKLGETKTTNLKLQVRTFPLQGAFVKPGLIGTGTYNERTSVLKIAKNGMGGWQYDSAINLNNFKYLVVRLARSSIYKPSFRLYDSSNLEDAYYSCDIAKETEVVIPLQDLVKSDGTALDLARIRAAGFSVGAAGSLYLGEISLTDDPTGIDRISLDDELLTQKDVTLYDLNGRPAVDIARKGVYVRNGKKVVIR